MPKKGQKIGTTALLTLLLTLTTVAVVAARDWIEGGTLIIYPDASNPMTQFDSVTVEYEYRFVETPGVTSAKLIGYTDAYCGGGTDRWGGVPVSAAATEQTTTLDGFTKLTMTPDPALLTSEIGSVTVEIRLQEPNHQMANRVDFYCRVVDHNATEAAAEAPADQPPLGEILGSSPVELHSITPGHVLKLDGTQWLFGTLATGDSVTADISYQFKNEPGTFTFALASSVDSCHTRYYQKSSTTPAGWVDVSTPIVRQIDQMSAREEFTFSADSIPADARSMFIRFERTEGGKRTGLGNTFACFNVEDHTIDLLSINPGFVLDESIGDGKRLGAIAPNATVTANMGFAFDSVPGSAEVRLMGRNQPCHTWLFNLRAPAFPTDSYPVSATSVQTFNSLQNNATITLDADQMTSATQSVYLEARAFENGVEIEHNVFLSCSDVTR